MTHLRLVVVVGLLLGEALEHVGVRRRRRRRLRVRGVGGLGAMRLPRCTVAHVVEDPVRQAALRCNRHQGAHSQAGSQAVSQSVSQAGRQAGRRAASLNEDIPEPARCTSTRTV